MSLSKLSFLSLVVCYSANTVVAQDACFPLSSRSDVARAYYDQALQAENNLDYVQAQDFLLEAIEADGHFFMAYVHYCFSLLEADRLDEAQALFARSRATVYQLQPGEKILETMVGVLAEDPQANLERFGNELVQLYPNCPEAWYWKGRLHLHAKNAEGAVLGFRKFATLQTGPLALQRLSQAYQLAGNSGKALQYLQQCMASFPENAGAVEGMGDFYLKQEAFAKAATYFDKALGLDNDRASTRQKLALAKRYIDHGK